MSRSKRQIAGRTGTANAVPSTVLFGELVLMVDVFCACIETGMLPKHGSPCHRRARWMVDASGQKPKRKRRPLLSPNVQDQRRREQQETTNAQET